MLLRKISINMNQNVPEIKYADNKWCLADFGFKD
jgi:hypothetical protein